MNYNFKGQDISFSKAATYKIVLLGEIDKDRVQNQWDLEVNVIKEDDGKFISTLVGKISDQAVLSGILNMLYDMHITILSVNILSEDDNH